MTKSQFEELFREEVLPYVIKGERAGFPDKPARREAWNNTVDSYIRDRQLPEAAGNWSHPRWLETAGSKRSSNDDYATMKKKRSSAQLNREIAEALTGKKRGRSRHSTITAAVATTPAKSKRVPKTRVVFIVQGNYGYGHGWEDLTAEETRKEALAQLRAYRENESAPFRLIRRREKINP